MYLPAMQKRITKISILLPLLLMSSAAAQTVARKVIPLGHGAAVTSVVFSPDGKMLASGSLDHLMKLWDPQSGELLRTLTTHTGTKNSLAFSNDGSTLAISSSDGSVGLYEPGTGKLIRSLPQAELGGPQAFSADGTLLVTKALNEKGSLRLWNIQTGKVVQTLALDSDDVGAIAFSPSGTKIVSIRRKVLKLWDAQSGKLLLNLNDSTLSLNDVTFAPDSATFAAADDVTIYFWDTQTGKLQKKIQSEVPSPNFEPPVRSIVFSPDGHLLAASSYDNTFTLLDVATGTARTRFRQESRPYAAAFSPDGTTIVTANEPKSLYFWDLASSELKLKIGTEAQSYAVGLSSDARMIASDNGFFVNAVTVWDSQSERRLWDLTGHDTALEILVFSPDGSMLCGSEANGNHVYVWNLRTGTLIKKIESTEFTEIASIAFSPDNKLLLVSGQHGDGIIRLIDTHSWQPLHNLLASSVVQEEDPSTKKMGPVRLGVIDAEFSTDGQTIAAIVNEGKDLKVWNTLTGKLIRTQPAKRDMSTCYFSTDLRVIYCGSEWWDVAKGNLIRTLAQPEGSNLIFSSDGKTFATSAEAVPGTAKDDTLIRLWDVQSGKLKTTLKGHLAQVASAQFSADGQLFVTGSHDGTVRLWDVASGASKHVFVLTDLQTNPN